MLSPITSQQGTEDVPTGYPSIPLSLSHVGSQKQYPELGSDFSTSDYELDGPGYTSMGGAFALKPDMRRGVGMSTESEEPYVTYPKQRILHPLNTVSSGYVVVHTCTCVCVREM